MKIYQYQILRYLPDRISGEFINLGVVVYRPEEKVVKGRFYTKAARLHSFFPIVNARHIIKAIKTLDAAIHQQAMSMQKPLFTNPPLQLNELTKIILPKDDSALFFTDSAKTLDITFDSALNDLYERFTLKYVQVVEDHDTLADKEVWKQLYKEYFDRYEITRKLYPKQVQTSMDTWNFERTVQNGSLHCFETVSFDLNNTALIKNKVYNWAGRIQELSTAKEQLHLYLLTALPDDKDLKKFIRNKLGNIKMENATVELVSTQSADTVLSKVKQQLQRSL